MNSETSKTRVAGYCRVSTKSDEQESSYDNQWDYFENEVRKMENYVFVGIYGDKGVSGVKTLERESFVDMLIEAGLDIVEAVNPNDPNTRIIRSAVANSVRKPKFDEIWVTSISRFSRNIAGSASIVEELTKKNVSVRFHDINKSTKDLSSFLIFIILQLVAQNDSMEKGQKVRFGKLQSAKRNGLNGRIPYGYEKDPKKTNSLKPKEGESEKVALIFELYSSGMGGRKITNYLKEHGIMKHESEPFSIKFITHMLRNAKYCGINI